MKLSYKIDDVKSKNLLNIAVDVSKNDLYLYTAGHFEGTLDMDQALRQVMESLQQEMKTASREQLQKIPSRLILMAFPALLMPALFLLVFPLAARLIASLQGMIWGSGF